MTQKFSKEDLAAAYAEPPPELHKFWLLQQGNTVQLVGNGGMAQSENEAKQEFAKTYRVYLKEVQCVGYYEKDCYFAELTEEEKRAYYFFGDS